jgi:hypothetical protein
MEMLVTLCVVAAIAAAMFFLGSDSRAWPEGDLTVVHRPRRNS